MNFPSLLSIGTAGIAALLGLIILFRGGSNLTLKTELQRRTQDIQTQQQEIQLQQQQYQAQQQSINTTIQLQQQLGPQVIGDMKVTGMRSNNPKIFALLAKYGVQVTDQEKEQIKKALAEEAKGKPGAGPTTEPKPAESKPAEVKPAPALR